jgi:hypothetical protein
MRTFVESIEEKVSAQIAGFCSNYTPAYASLLNVNADDMTNLNKGSVFLIFILMMMGKLQTAATAFTAYKDLLMTGKGGGVLGVLPVLTVYPTTPAPPPVALLDLISLFRDIIQQCVKSGNLTEDMAKALGIFEEPIVVILADGTPTLSLKSMSAGHPTLHTIIGDYEGFEIWKDSGAGFVFLNVSNGPNFTDTSALPAVGVDAIWNYKIIYRLKNVQIGNWSNVIAVAVRGVV